jgi:hypothetical protein
MVHGNQWATSTEISVATRILQSNINIWLQGRDGHSNICFTKEEYMFFFPSDILFLYILFSFENESSLLFCCIAMLVE